MEYTDILFKVEEHIATISLNRPERLNAATFAMGEQLQDALGRADGDADVRVIVLTGEGRAFCAGDDVEQAWQDNRMEETLRQLGDARAPMTPEARMMLSGTKPTIAAVNGAAVGIGMDFAILCDIVIASEHAKFGQLFVKLGLMADITGYWRLPQLVGQAKATELLLTGDIIDAQEGLRIGLVSRVVAADQLLPVTYEMAGKIAANPPLSVRYIKEGLRRGIGRSYGELEELASYVGNGLARLFATEDHKEAAAAFLEKRTPVFKGR